MDPADEPARALTLSVTRAVESREIQRAEMWRGFDKRLRQAEREMLQVWGPVLEGMAAHVVRRVREIAPTISASVGSRARADTPPPILTPLPGHPMDYLPDAAALVRAVVEEHGLAYESIVKRFGAAAIEALASRLVFDEGTPTVLRLVDRDAARVGEEVHRLLNELRDTLEGGINQGEGIAELVDRIRTRVSPARSERIARTEAIAAANSGTVEGYRQAGIEQHEWLSSRDAFVRDPQRA